MRLTLLLLILSFTITSLSQTITTIDYVKTKPGEHHDYLLFVQKNWVVAREKAKDIGYIISFRYDVNRLDTFADVTLITVYRNESTFVQRENIFKDIFKEFFPDGAILINGKRSRDMADIRMSKEMRKEN